MIRILTINILVFILFYFIIEILSGNLIYKNKLSCGYLKCNFNKQYEIDLYTDKKILIEFKKNSLGFRGDEIFPDKIDIIFMGGSTTAQRYLNERDTWVSKLEQKFISKGMSVKFVNAGIDGQSSFGHIWNLKNWVPKIKKINPSYIIFYMGLNEYGNKRGFFDNNLNLSNNQNKTFNLFHKIKYYIIINRGITLDFINIYHKIFYKNKLKTIGHQKTNLNEIEYFDTLNNVHLREDLSNFKTNLNTIYELTNKLNSKPIFITQRTQRWRDNDGKILSVNNEENYYDFEKSRSDTIINFCNEKKLICINMFKSVKDDIFLTYDLIHLNPIGSEYLANLIFNELYSILKND